MRSLYTLDFHALRMRAVELAATQTPRESICSRKAATAAAGRASSALRAAAPIQRALWQRIVSSSIDLNRPHSNSIDLNRPHSTSFDLIRSRSTCMGEDLKRSLVH